MINVAVERNEHVFKADDPQDRCRSPQCFVKREEAESWPCSIIRTEGPGITVISPDSLVNLPIYGDQFVDDFWEEAIAQGVTLRIEGREVSAHVPSNVPRRTLAEVASQLEFLCAQGFDGNVEISEADDGGLTITGWAD